MVPLFKREKKTFVIRIYEINPFDPSRSICSSFERIVVTYKKRDALYTARAVVALHNKKRDYADDGWCEWLVGEIRVKGKGK
ncbi:MAG: hypothetical protein WC505_00140 [Patescibacteria group bacterium]